MSLRSHPPRVMRPFFASQKPPVGFAMVDLPPPLGPAKAAMLPEGPWRTTSNMPLK